MRSATPNSRSLATLALVSLLWAALVMFGLAPVASADGPGGAVSPSSPSPPPSSSPPSSPQEIPCDDARARAVAERVQARYDQIQDFSADFEQRSESVLLGAGPLADAPATTGHVIFAKPGRMRWTYETPAPSLVVSDGQTLWIFDVSDKSITKMPVTEGYLTGAALQFLLGDGKILESFDVRATACSGDRVTLDLLPIRDSGYERLGLVASSRTGDIESTSVVDLFGNVTRISFRSALANQSPAPETFKLEIPAGVEVIELAPVR